MACPQRAQCLAPGRTARPQLAHLVIVAALPTGRPHWEQKTASSGSVRPQCGQAERASSTDRAGDDPLRADRRLNRQPTTNPIVPTTPIAIKPNQLLPSSAGG